MTEKNFDVVVDWQCRHRYECVLSFRRAGLQPRSRISRRIWITWDRRAAMPVAVTRSWASARRSSVTWAMISAGASFARSSRATASINGGVHRSGGDEPQHQLHVSRWPPQELLRWQEPHAAAARSRGVPIGFGSRAAWRISTFPTGRAAAADRQRIGRDDRVRSAGCGDAARRVSRRFHRLCRHRVLLGGESTRSEAVDRRTVEVEADIDRRVRHGRAGLCAGHARRNSLLSGRSPWMRRLSIRTARATGWPWVF